MDVNMSNGCGYIVLDASNAIELMGVTFKIVVFAFDKRVKRKATRKNINKIRTRRKLYI